MWLALKQRRTEFNFSIFIFSYFLVAQSVAMPSFRLGGQLGFGGTGIEKSVNLQDTSVQVSRSNGPGVLGLFLELPLSSTSSFALERYQGFTLSPYSSDVTFTGFTYKGYFQPMPSMVASDRDQTTLLIQQIVFFLGGTVGQAKGTIVREGDAVPEVASSGVYFGGHAGFDYQVEPNWFYRPEIIFGSTLGSSSLAPAKMSMFGLMFGLVYIF